MPIITGSTAILYSRGARNASRPIRTHQLFEKFNGLPSATRPWDLQHQTKIHAFDPSTKIVAYERVAAVRRAGVAEIVSLTTEAGLFSEVPVEQLVLTTNGLLVAGDLRERSELVIKGSMMPAAGRGRVSRDGIQREVIEALKYYPCGSRQYVPDAYGDYYSYKRQFRSRLTVEANMNNLSLDEFVRILKRDPDAARNLKFLPRGVEVHHKDGNRANDRLENLEVLCHKAHAKKHGWDQRKFKVEYWKTVSVARVSRGASRVAYEVDLEQQDLLTATREGLFFF